MNDPSSSKSEAPNPEEALAFIWTNVERIGNCMMVTRTQTGLRARPMRGLARPDENSIWFFTSASDEKDDEVLLHPEVCISYSDVGSNTYVSLSGVIERTNDPVKIHQLWNPGATAYFPKGPDDPDILLFKFTPVAGEYWDAPSNPVVLAVQFIKAKVMGEKVSLGENAKVVMGN